MDIEKKIKRTLKNLDKQVKELYDTKYPETAGKMNSNNELTAYYWSACAADWKHKDENERSHRIMFTIIKALTDNNVEHYFTISLK